MPENCCMNAIEKNQAKAQYLKSVQEFASRFAALPISQTDFAEKYGFFKTELSLAKSLKRIPKPEKLAKLMKAVIAEEEILKQKPKSGKICPMCGK